MMKDIHQQLEDCLNSKAPFALATVLKTWRSTPRVEGSAMAITKDGVMYGSVSGGCVEGAVVKAAQQVIEDGAPQLLAFGVSDEDAWTVGLSCGGQIEVWVERVDSVEPAWRQWIDCVRNNQGCVLVSALQPPYQHYLYTRESHLREDLQARSLQAYQHRKTEKEEQYFYNVFPSKSKMLIIGAAHVSLDLLQLAHQYDFETSVIDPRGIFATEERFKVTPDHLFEDWPAEVIPQLELDSDTYVVVLTHDPKIDDQALHLVLPAPVAYVGALGSKKTHAKRKARLLEAGRTEAEIDRIQGPIGININARKPGEIALSIMAQIIQVRNQHL